jgi:hypothetical protein
MSGKGIPKQHLEAEFSQYLTKIIPKKKWLTAFKETVLELWKERGNQSKVEIRRHETYLSLLETKLSRIYEMREDGSYTKEEFQTRKTEVEGEKALTQVALNSLQIEDFDIEAVLTYVFDFIGSLAQKWPILSITSQGRFQKLVFPEGIPYVRNQGFGTARIGYIFELIQSFGGQKSPKADLGGISWNQFEEDLRKLEEAIRECKREDQYISAA